MIGPASVSQETTSEALYRLHGPVRNKIHFKNQIKIKVILSAQKAPWPTGTPDGQSTPGEGLERGWVKKNGREGEKGGRERERVHERQREREREREREGEVRVSDR